MVANSHVSLFGKLRTVGLSNNNRESLIFPLASHQLNLDGNIPGALASVIGEVKIFGGDRRDSLTGSEASLGPHQGVLAESGDFFAGPGVGSLDGLSLASSGVRQYLTVSPATQMSSFREPLMIFNCFNFGKGFFISWRCLYRSSPS